MKTDVDKIAGQRKTMVLRSVGLDWLTLSYEHSQVAEIESILVPYFADLERAGHIPEPSYRFGYKGMSTDGIFLGERDDSALLVLPSYHADVLFRAVYPHSRNVSRIDLECSVSPPRESEGEEADTYWYEAGVRAYDTGKRLCTQCKVSMMQSQGDGLTVYVGGRTSEWYGRFYRQDTHPKSGGQWPKYTWRLEVEIKGEPARLMARALYGLTPERQTKAILSTVVHWYDSRNIDTPAVYPHDDRINIIKGKRETNLEGKLNWLRRGVRPTVDMLRDKDYLTEVLRALGFFIPAHVPGEEIERLLKQLREYRTDS